MLLVEPHTQQTKVSLEIFLKYWQLLYAVYVCILERIAPSRPKLVDRDSMR